MGCVSRFTPAARVLALAAALVAPGAAGAQGSAQQQPGSPPLAKATFAGGCFWCMEASKATVEKSKSSKEPIVTPIAAAGDFWPAEDYHQDYYTKNPARYKHYRTGCGRDARLMQLWGKAGD